MESYAVYTFLSLCSNVWHFAGGINTVLNIISTKLLHKDHLSVAQQEVLNKLLSSRLANSPKVLGWAKNVTHYIELLSGSVPLKQRYYLVSLHKQKYQFCVGYNRQLNVRSRKDAYPLPYMRLLAG